MLTSSMAKRLTGMNCGLTAQYLILTQDTVMVYRQYKVPCIHVSIKPFEEADALKGTSCSGKAHDRHAKSSASFCD